MANAIPTTMKSARLVSHVNKGIREFSRDELQQCIQVLDVPLRPLKSGEVLVRVEKTVINPADLSNLKGTYGNKNEKDSYQPKDKNEKEEKNEGAPLGSEGSGVVVASGGGLLAWRVMGKRVGFVTQGGAWSEYVILDATRVIDIGNASFSEGASCFVNPLTTIAFLEIALSRGEKSLVHTAAASALGKMLIKNGKRKGIDVICVVRSQSQVEACKEAGAVNIVNSSDEDWVKQLRDICEKNKTRLAFDAISGPMTGNLLYALCDGGEVQVYGGLSELPANNVSTRDLIFKKKSVTGFWLVQYMKSKWTLGLLQWTWEVTAQLTGDFKTDYAKDFPLSEIHEALLSYSKDMSSGKILLSCSSSTEAASPTTEQASPPDSKKAKTEESDQ